LERKIMETKRMKCNCEHNVREQKVNGIECNSQYFMHLTNSYASKLAFIRDNSMLIASFLHKKWILLSVTTTPVNRLKKSPTLFLKSYLGLRDLLW